MADASLNGQVVDHWFLQWRLGELIASGAIECEGKLPAWDEGTAGNAAMVRRAI
jgi:hypothetical protein